MIFCTNCGQQNDDAARHCTNCGKAFGGQSGSTPFTTAEPAGTTGTQQPGSPWAAPPYGDQGYYAMQQQARPGLYAVGEKRDPILVLVLSFVTCGIYALYWQYVMMTEIKNALGRDDLNPGLDLLLGIITCGIYLIYLNYKYPQLMLEMQDRVRLPRNDVSLIAVLLSVFGLYMVATFIVQTELNKIWDTAR